MNTLQDFKDGIAKSIFGTTVKETTEKGICINCNEWALNKCYSEAGKREFFISGMCEECFDKIV